MATHRFTVVSVLLILGFLSNTIQSLRFDLQSGHTKCIAEDIKSNSMTVGKYSIVNPNEGHSLPESHKLTVRVTSASGNSFHYSDHVPSGQFAFQATEAGDYMACFWAADHKPETTITIDFEWKTGVAAKDWTNVAKKGSIDGVQPVYNQKQTKRTRTLHVCFPSFSLLAPLQFLIKSIIPLGNTQNAPKSRQHKIPKFICHSSVDEAMELELKKLFETVTSIHDEMFYLREREEEMQELNKTTNSRMAWLSFLSLFVCLSVAGLQLWHLKTFFEKKKLI